MRICGALLTLLFLARRNVQPKLTELRVNAAARDLVELMIAVPEEARRRRPSPVRPEALLEALPEVCAQLAEEERDRGEDQGRCSADRQPEALGYYCGQE